MTKKLISIVLIYAMIIMQVGPALAQTDAPPPPTAQSEPPPAPVTETQPAPAPESPKVDISECIERGRAEGREAGTGGSFLGGFVGGVLLGLIGTGIAYAVQGEPDTPATLKYQFEDAKCRLAFDDAFGEQGKKRKKSAALTGGLLGTALLVLVVVSASGD